MTIIWDVDVKFVWILHVYDWITENLKSCLAAQTAIPIVKQISYIFLMKIQFLTDFFYSDVILTPL